MNARMQKFAELIAAGAPTGKQAAIAAGYAPRSATVRASRLMRTTAVRLEIQRIRSGVPRLVDQLPPNASPLDYILARMRDPFVDPRVRVRMARAAAPYCGEDA